MHPNLQLNQTVKLVKYQGLYRKDPGRRNYLPLVILPHNDHMLQSAQAAEKNLQLKHLKIHQKCFFKLSFNLFFQISNLGETTKLSQ